MVMTTNTLDTEIAQEQTNLVVDQSAYPDDAFLKSLDLSDYELEFAQLEFGRGLPYYLQRLDRLAFQGDRVLDAGCGVGQWSLALAQRFQHVDAIDLKGDRLDTLKIVVDRLGVDNITIQQGSVTAIPYEDNTFDAIFCYGVIMFTPIQETLKEFERVLKPGGRVYICLNGYGWFKNLKETKPDPVNQRYMAHILAKSRLHQHLSTDSEQAFWSWIDIAKATQRVYKQFGKLFWRTSLQNPLAKLLLAKTIKKDEVLKKLYKEFKEKNGKEGLSHWLHFLLLNFQSYKGRGLFSRHLEYCIQQLGWSHIQFRHTLNYPTFQEAMRSVQNHADLLLEDLEDNRHGDPTRAYSALDLAPYLEEANLVDFQYASESELVCTPSIPKPTPMYEEKLGVWEAVFAKSEVFPDGMTPESHYQAAILASQNPVYLSNTSKPVLSNGGTMESYPQTLLAYAEEKARHLGGREHLKWLVETLTRNSHSETEKASSLITFVQRAIYRDPVSQPLTPEGQLPEADVILQTHRGRCGHSAKLLSTLFEVAGIENETVQYPRHVALKAKVDGQWVLAEADAFKHGILPQNSENNNQGQLLSMEDLQANPRILDRFPLTGWASFPNSPHTQDAFGHQVTGYIGAETFAQRGFLSGYFDETLIEYPPSLPEIVQAEIVSKTDEGIQLALSWTASHCPGEPVAYYGVSIGSHSRGWDYANPSTFDKVSIPLPSDCLKRETSETSLSVLIPQDKRNALQAKNLFISITAFGARIQEDPQTFYWPSKEVVLDLS
jgi:ubiquinone/menaquinone biosynthesis C-methylase UbiE